MYIKQIDQDHCEAIQMVFEENEVVYVFSEITTANLEIFLKGAEAISESEYNNIYERYAQT